jgi:hypothetical protein
MESMLHSVYVFYHGIDCNLDFIIQMQAFQVGCLKSKALEDLERYKVCVMSYGLQIT